MDSCPLKELEWAFLHLTLWNRCPRLLGLKVCWQPSYSHFLSEILSANSYPLNSR